MHVCTTGSSEVENGKAIVSILIGSSFNIKTLTNISISYMCEKSILAFTVSVCGQLADLMPLVGSLYEHCL